MSLIKTFNKRLFNRLPTRYLKTHKISIKSIETINKPLYNKQFILGYHKIRDYDDNKILNSIIENGFCTYSILGNKGDGAYFATHSTYPFLWGGNTKFIMCQLFLDTDYISVYRSELPPGYELVVSDNININPLYAINAKLVCIDKLHQDIDSNYWEPGKTGCQLCDKKEERCDCKLSFQVLDNLILDDQKFMKETLKDNILYIDSYK
jgi:hypothetical protein